MKVSAKIAAVCTLIKGLSPELLHIFFHQLKFLSLHSGVALEEYCRFGRSTGNNKTTTWFQWASNLTRMLFKRTGNK